MALATPAQIKMLHVLKGKHGMDDETYRNMIHEASNGRTTTSKELTQTEAFKLLDGLARETPEAKSADKMRKKIIGLARECGWINDQNKADMERINWWCQKYGYMKKPLNDYSLTELPKLVSQFEFGPYKDHLNKV